MYIIQHSQCIQYTIHKVYKPAYSHMSFHTLQFAYGIDHLKVPPGSVPSTLQWITIGGIPVAFLFGCLIVHRKRRSLYVIMDKLYGECELQKQLMQTNGVHANDTKRIKVNNIQSILPEPSALRVIKRSPYVSMCMCMCACAL